MNTVPHRHYWQYAAAIVSGITVATIITLVIFSPGRSRPATSVTLHSATLGDTVRSNSFCITADHIRYDSVGDATYVPGDGYKYVILSVIVKNCSDRQIYLSPVVQLSLLTDTGDSYTLAPAPLDTPLAAGSLAPGDEQKGEVSFSIPISTTHLQLLCNQAPASGGVISISLN